MSEEAPAAPAIPARTAVVNQWRPGSGPVVALLFHRALSAVFLVAWISLGRQILLLVGRRGLLPLADFAAAARAEEALSPWAFPGVLAWMPADAVLFWGTVAGAALSLLSLGGWRPRLCAALQTAWYLGYVTACRGFLSFQWDNLLLECGLLGAFLPATRASPVSHLLLRALLFKLYFESGLAKWQSPLHDWQDGTAMTFYYETAPLPTALAWYAHHLPRWWHLFESRATLAIELVLPFAIFGPRRVRQLAAALFTLFQVINAATANYGFFCYLTGALHLFLLDDRDLHSIADRMRQIARPLARDLRDFARRLLAHGPRRLAAFARQGGTIARRAAPAPASSVADDRAHHPNQIRRWLGAGLRWAGVATWVFVSLTEALFHFGDPSGGLAGPRAEILLPVLTLSQTFRVVNTFHLFAAVTRQRIEPEIQIQSHGDWTAYDLRYKAGDLARPPRFVAPHQPRVDFLLWFYGLGYQQRQPTYVAELLGRLCEDPAAVAPLFRGALPASPDAVRIVFWDYRFTSAEQRRVTGAWWTRRELDSTTPLACR